jgi:hypothetical protein
MPLMSIVATAIDQVRTFDKAHVAVARRQSLCGSKGVELFTSSRTALTLRPPPTRAPRCSRNRGAE